MILFYIDESGTSLEQKPDPKNKQTNFFLMASVGIHAQNIAEIDSEFSLLKRHIVSWMEPEDWELKGVDFIQNDKQKKSTKPNPFKGKEWEERKKAFLKVSETIDKFPCDLFAVRVDKLLLREIYNLFSPD